MVASFAVCLLCLLGKGALEMPAVSPGGGGLGWGAWGAVAATREGPPVWLAAWVPWVRLGALGAKHPDTLLAGGLSRSSEQ